MKRTLMLITPILLATAPLQGSWVSSHAPKTVSPGSPQRIQTIEQRCPTFSWGAVDRAASYELAVFRADAASSQSTGKRGPIDRRVSAAPSIYATIPAPASSWTPSMDQCLEPGGTYAWYVREVRDSAAFTGEWSEGTLFRVADGRVPGKDPAMKGGPGKNGAGGIPEVLNQLALLQQQVAENQAAIDDRFDELEAQIAANQALLTGRFDKLDFDLFGPFAHDAGFLVEHHESVQPCTPQRWRDGKCADNNHPLDIQTTFCFTLDLGGEFGAEFVIEPGMAVEAGGSWHEVPNVQLSASAEFPLLITGPLTGLPRLLPDYSLGWKAGGGAGLEICFEGLTLEASQLQGGPDADAFAQQLVDAVEARASDIVTAATDFAGQRNLNPDRFVDALNKLRDLKGGGFDLQANEDPLAILKRGEFRSFVDALPLGEGTQSLLDDPGAMVPSFDRDNPLAVCERFDPSSVVGTRAAPICDFVKNDMPDLAALADFITQDLPGKVIDDLCDATSLDCEGGIGNRNCREDCSDVFDVCKNKCGPFQSKCRADCRQKKRDCNAGC